MDTPLPPRQIPFGPRATLAAAGASGLLAAMTAVGVGHVIASVIAPAASPLFAVGSTVIDLTPEGLKSFAIVTFGQNDKAALLGGMSVAIAGLAILVGLLSLRQPRMAALLFLGFGLAGAVAAGIRPAASLANLIPSIVGGVIGMATLLFLHRQLVGADAPGSARVGVRTASATADESPSRAPSRRGFLVGAAGVGLLALGSGLTGLFVSGRRAGSAAAAAIEIPSPVDPASPIPAGSDLGIEGVAPFITPNADFYRVDTALDIPVIAAADWRLRIHGMVDREVELTLADLLDLPTIERDITLTCVSNQVGGQYVGNARWIGVPLRTVLEEAGIRPGADQIVSRSIDGMTIGTPTAVALDGRDAMLAVAMNGEPLPAVHGFPVRMLVPGLYGYVSATKWLVDIELTTFDAYDPYWVQRGWDKEAPIKTMARIDAPKPLARLAAGRVVVGGVAWAQHRDIERVEVRIDGDTWEAARLAEVDSIDTWRQWTYDWTATSGNHTLEVRATDHDGMIQTESRNEPFPNGASGWHSVVVTVI